MAFDLGVGVQEFARAAEERGLQGIWLPDHSHIPTSRNTPFLGGGDLPERYKRTIDPIVGLTYAAAVTETLRLGTGVLLAGQRDPITTAKALATLDQLSAGRLQVGAGYGWNIEEMLDHAVEPTTRRSRTREHVLAMRELWQRDVASFTGDYVNFGESWSWPKPVQHPLPVLIGGRAGRAVFDQVAEYAQGWIPVGGHGLAEAARRLQDRCRAVGRDPASIEIIPFTSSQPDLAKWSAFAAAGATEIAFEVLSEDRDEMLRAIDGLAVSIEEWQDHDL